MVPVADAFRGSPVAARDRRLAWLTGFDGSAGLCAVTQNSAALFVDGRYTAQAAAQTDPTEIEVRAAGPGGQDRWLADAVPENGSIGFDPWLHGIEAVEKLESSLPGRILVPTDNLIDRIWHDQPPAPVSPLVDYPVLYAGESRTSKVRRVAGVLSENGLDSAVITDANSIAWLLNVRAADVPRTPLKRAFAILGRDSRVKLFANLPHGEPGQTAWLHNTVSIHSFDQFAASLDALDGRVLIDPGTASWVAKRLARRGIETVRAPDPCAALKTRKNKWQIFAIRHAHFLDGVAVTAFLAWLDSAASEHVSEIDAARKLEECRRETGCLRDISFDTISASGPNAAIIHYRVTSATNRALEPGSLYLVDSGGQFLFGTTDVTRTVAIGQPRLSHRQLYTAVLRGLIALSTARWPEHRTGRDLDTLARQFLWNAGHDYDHGTGHGVGQFLNVHEGPAGISHRTESPLAEGMIVSIEPGCYVPGAFGIRLENLAAVRCCGAQPASPGNPMLRFETLTLAPFDQRLIEPELLAPAEKRWLNAYHARVLKKLHKACAPAARAWLETACRPIG